MPRPADPDVELLSVTAVARLVRLDEAALMEEILAGRLKAMRRGQRWRVPRWAIRRWQEDECGASVA